MNARSLFPVAFFALLGACRETDTVSAPTKPPAGSGIANPAITLPAAELAPIEPATEFLVEGNPNAVTIERLNSENLRGTPLLLNPIQIEDATDLPAFRGLMRGGTPTDLGERIQVKP